MEIRRWTFATTTARTKTTEFYITICRNCANVTPEIVILRRVKFMSIDSNSVVPFRVIGWAGSAAEAGLPLLYVSKLDSQDRVGQRPTLLVNYSCGASMLSECRPRLNEISKSATS